MVTSCKTEPKPKCITNWKTLVTTPDVTKLLLRKADTNILPENAELRAAVFDMHGKLNRAYSNSPVLLDISTRLEIDEGIKPHFSLSASEGAFEIATFNMYLPPQSQNGIVTKVDFSKYAQEHGFEMFHDSTAGNSVWLIDAKTRLLFRVVFD